MTYLRNSPLLSAGGATSGSGDMQAYLASVALADMSFLQRGGLKGPGAAQWLQAQGIQIPADANRWAGLPGGGAVARLGRSEFFLEDGAGGDAVRRVKAALGHGADGAYPVIRQDAGIALLGPRANELLVQTCNVNFEAIADHEAVMTLMVGVGVLAIRRNLGSQSCLRLWCDPTFAPYLWETLVEIAAELGGGVVDPERLPA